MSPAAVFLLSLSLAQPPGWEPNYQSGLGHWATQLAVEIDTVRNEIRRSNYPLPVKFQLTAQANQSIAAIDGFRRLASQTDNRAQLYAADKEMDRLTELLVTTLKQVGPISPPIAGAITRGRYADAQLHAALYGGDPNPGSQKERVERLAIRLDDQTEDLERAVRAVWANAPHGLPLLQSVQLLNRQTDQLRQAARRGDYPQTAREYGDVTATWQNVQRVIAANGAPPAVRQAAVRTDAVYRELGEAIRAAGGGWGPGPQPPGPPPGFLQPGKAIAIGAGDGGGPRVRVFQDLTGSPPVDFFAYDPNFRGGVRVAVADVTGDGVPDIITVPGPGMPVLVRIFDGTNLNLIQEFPAYEPGWTGGAFVAAADRNKFGKAIIVTGTDNGAGPHVKVFQAGSRRELDSFFAYEESFRGGVRVALGDVDGDGIADLVTSPGPGGGPLVRVYNGRNRAKMAEFFALEPTDRCGLWVATADLTRNGKAEVIVGTDAGVPARVRVYEAMGGRYLLDVPAFRGFAGGVRVGAFDVNGDGTPDIVCGPGPGRVGAIEVFDGRTRRAMGGFPAMEAGFAGGLYLGGR